MNNRRASSACFVIPSSPVALDECTLEAVVGGGSDDDNDDGYFNWGDTERNGHGFDMVCPDPSADGGMSWRYIGST